jgi:hypothetical protein
MAPAARWLARPRRHRILCGSRRHRLVAFGGPIEGENGAIAGQLWFEAGDSVKAAASFRCAAELATVTTEKNFLMRRLVEVDG